MAFQKIVVATDMSETSERVAQEAMAVARHSGAELVLVHATGMSEAQENQYERSLGKPEEFRALLKESVERVHAALEAQRQRLVGQGVEVSKMLTDSPPERGVVALAEEVGADLIVLGSHGRTGIKRFLLGSIAEKVVRHSPVSVLVARGSIGARGYETILVPTDFSEQAEKAIELAKAVAVEGCMIDVLHCWHLPPSIIGYYDEGATAVLPLVKALGEDADLEGKKLVDRHRTGRFEMTFHHMQAPPAHGIQAYIEDKALPPQLVVVGSHGRTGIGRFFLGSVAEATVRHSTCSVLVAR